MYCNTFLKAVVVLGAQYYFHLVAVSIAQYFKTVVFQPLQLNNVNDKIDDVQRLPSGPEPMLIRRDKHVPLYSVLCNLERDFKTDASKKSKSVGIVIVPGSLEIETVVCSKWAMEDSENRTFVPKMSSITGCEFDTLIVCGYEPFFIAELATRAREKLLLITTCG